MSAFYDGIVGNLYAHGGITFAEPYPERFGNDKWYLGFDCGHYGDGWQRSENSISCLFSNFPVKTRKYVRDNIKNLVKQLIKLEKEV